MVEEKSSVRRADPSALGLAAFAATTFLVSVYNVMGGGTMPLLAVFLFAGFYGGLAQFVAGLFAYRREDTFGATLFTSYGAFYLALATFGGLMLRGSIVPGPGIERGLAWSLVAYGVVTLGLLLQSFWMNRALSLVMFGIEITEILLLIGYFRGETAGAGLVIAGGVVGLATALIAWYASVAALVNSMAGSDVLPVGHATAAGGVHYLFPPQHRAA